MRKYENLECLHENTLKPRSYYIPYDTEKKTKNGDKTKSDYYTLLRQNEKRAFADEKAQH